MVTCKVDKEISGAVLGYELPTWQTILVHKVLPSVGGLCIYLVLMCFDVAMVFEHYKNGDERMASFLIVLMILPSVLSLIFTLASPPPGLQTEETAFAIQIQKSDVLWIFMQILNCILFPVAAIGRYCHQIFWWMEAVCTSYSEEDDRLQEALHRAHEPSPLELYLFLQAFVHAAPNAVINILDLMSRSTSSMSFDRVQAVSIIASTLRMASTAAIYRRFEREKLCGRRYPWKTLEEDQQNNTNEQKEQSEEHIYEPLRFSQVKATDKIRENSDLIQFSPANQEDKGFFEEDYESETDFIEPDEIRRKNSEDQYIRPISIIDRAAPRRRDTQYTIEKVRLTPPPEMPAPRPMSLAAWAEKVVENAEAIPSWLSAPHRSKYHDLITDEPDIPRYSPRPYLRGLEPQDATAALVHFLGWYMFFVSRLTSIAAFINFYPVLAITTLFTHYQVMLLLLIVPKASSVRRAFYIFLAFIYLFCLMEFKIRFRHVRVWHVFWLVVSTVETIIFTALWATINNNLNWWWKEYVIVVIFGSLLLSYMCLLVYFVLLKPRETIVYIENKESK